MLAVPSSLGRGGEIFESGCNGVGRGSAGVVSSPWAPVLDLEPCVGVAAGPGVGGGFTAYVVVSAWTGLREEA